VIDKKKVTTRVQLELPEGAMARLRSLRDRTEAASYSEVVRRALQLYETTLNEAGVVKGSV